MSGPGAARGKRGRAGARPADLSASTSPSPDGNGTGNSSVSGGRRDATAVASGEDAGAWQTLQRGFALSPALRHGIRGTLALAVLSTGGGAVVPIVVQQTIDNGLTSSTGADRQLVTWLVLGAAVVVAFTAWAAYAMKVRLFVASENGLAELRVQAFRHVHDLPVLTQNTERRGALVSRVTSDIDQVSLFLQYAGVFFVVSVGQVIVATAVMAVYSWELTLVVWVCFLPLVLALRSVTGRMTVAYGRVRRSVGDMLSVIAEPVVGASVVKAHGIEARTQGRVDHAIDVNYRRQVEAQRLVAVTFASAGLAGGLASAAVVVVGVWLGVGGQLSIGTVIAFAFLVSLLVGPVQMATQVLTEAQNAVASWRRVIALLETPADVSDPGVAGTALPDRPLDVTFDGVGFAYPDGPLVLHDIELEIPAGRRVAVVGETGSGKTTFAKLLTRLMDPVRGAVLVGGVDLRAVPFASLRRRVVMVPQEGFLFDASLGDNLRYGRPGAGDDDLVAALNGLGLGEWYAGLPDGLGTEVGQRGESLSAGERQLVALMRAALADPDLLVEDEHRRGRRRGAGLRRRPAGGARCARPAGGRARRLCPAARLVGGAVTAGAGRAGTGSSVSALDPQVSARLKRDGNGLVAAVVQDATTSAVLMVGWMDDAAVHRTLTSGRVTFFSRSRGRLWVKGETSGHRQWVREVRLDCDADTLLVLVDIDGPACHTGAETCFDNGRLDAVVVPATER